MGVRKEDLTIVGAYEDRICTRPSEFARGWPGTVTRVVDRARETKRTQSSSLPTVLNCDASERLHDAGLTHSSKPKTRRRSARGGIRLDPGGNHDQHVRSHARTQPTLLCVG